jgi:hypothetical protein
MRFATFTMSGDPHERVGLCTPDGASLVDIAQVSEDAGRPRWGDIVSLIAAAADGASSLAPHPRSNVGCRTISQALGIPSNSEQIVERML